MGRVYSPAAVEGGHLPDETSFEQAITTYDELVRSAITNGPLVTSVGFGPLATENPISIRSNIDALLVHNGTRLGAAACRTIKIETARASGDVVQVNALPYSYTLLASGDHDIDRYSGQQLANGQRVVIGEDPEQYILYPPEYPLFILSNYLSQKKRRLAEAHVSGDVAGRLLGIQEMLETPIAVGRKVLQVVDELQGTERYPGSVADKQSVASESLALYSELAADDLPLLLLFADNHYTQILKHALHHRVSHGDYRNLLDELDDLTIPTISWLSRLGVRLPLYAEGSLTA